MSEHKVVWEAAWVESQGYALMRSDGSFLKVNGWAVKVFDSLSDALRRQSKTNAKYPKNPYFVVPRP